ncbi:SDR family oxidoreductase [bacterium]|nr:SDR family oxidoreductase [bacterium]
MHHILVTGASSGIGLELARLFAAGGHPLVLVARRAARLTALAETLRRDHEVSVHVIPLDLTAPGAVEALVAELARLGLGIRVLVNNAGIGAYGPFLARPLQVHDDLLELNVAVPMRLAHRLLPAMVAAAGTPGPGPGVLNVASTAAFQPGPLMASYFAAKAHLLHHSEALHEELRGRGVTVTAFCPGPTRSGFFTTDAMLPPEARDATGELVAAARTELARRDARRMDTAVAARAGYEGFLAGRAVVVPGVRNRLLTVLVRLLPRGVVRRAAHRGLRR